jgi:predicted DNA-binding transcriptional regulator YafY
MKSFELASLFSRITPDGHGGGVVETENPKQELDYYASRLLSVGTDVVVRSPPELVEALRSKAREVAKLYG